ncbi:MAG: hypothetical protein JSV68_01995 [Anaerolineaceae bacterium]|nr:MAG: hypothetical protein JSV68_01995 [Anaerolineaceae bacterium]
MKKTLCLIATLLIAPILLAACGSGDISGDTSIDDGVNEVAVTAMTNKDKIVTKENRIRFLQILRTITFNTGPILILSLLVVGCSPSTEELEAVEYTPLPGDDR